MIKTAYNAIGTLSSVLLASSRTVTFDSTLQGILNSLLSIGDWTYLTIDDGINTEVIKVYRIVGARLEVLRAQDNSISYSFAANSKVYYELTAAEIVDKVTISSLSINGYGGIVVNGANIGYGPITVQNLGGMDTIVSVDELILDWAKQLQTCCNLLKPGAPPIAPPFEYLTSTIYPIEDIEALISSVAIISGFLYTETIDAMTSALTVISGDLHLVLIRTTAPPDALTSALVIISGDLHTVLVRTTAPPDAMTSALTIISGDLHTVIVRNTKLPDALTSALQILSGSLT